MKKLFWKEKLIGQRVHTWANGIGYANPVRDSMVTVLRDGIYPPIESCEELPH